MGGHPPAFHGAAEEGGGAMSGAADSAGCSWIISSPGWPYRECGAQPTQRDPDTGALLCDYHAEDYAAVFGWESLRSIGAGWPNAPRSSAEDSHE